MLYLGIDQHARQITISLRDETGDVVQARQVSTEPKKMNAFFQQLTRQHLRKGESFVAVLEVCGFNDWLIRMLRDYRCHKVIWYRPTQPWSGLSAPEFERRRFGAQQYKLPSKWHLRKASHSLRFRWKGQKP